MYFYLHRVIFFKIWTKTLQFQKEKKVFPSETKCNCSIFKNSFNGSQYKNRFFASSSIKRDTVITCIITHHHCLWPGSSLERSRKRIAVSWLIVFAGCRVPRPCRTNFSEDVAPSLNFFPFLLLPHSIPRLPYCDSCNRLTFLAHHPLKISRNTSS